MSKIVARILFLVLFAGSANAQLPVFPQWQLVRDDLAGSTDMVFTSHDTGYVFGGGHLQRTVDSGDHFLQLKLPNNAGGQQTNMSWPTNTDGYIGFAAGRTMLVRTHDAGTTWDTVLVKPLNMAFDHISFPTVQIGYATGSYLDGSGNDTGHFVAKSTDGGATWTSMYESATHRYSHVVFNDALNGVFLDNVKDQTAFVVDKTTNGMNTVTVTTGTLQDPSEPNFLEWNGPQSLIVGIGGVMQSTNGGSTWAVTQKDNPSKTDASGFGSGAITTACFYGPGGFAFEDLGGRFYATTDFGTTWFPGTTAPGGQGQHDTLQPAASSFPAPTIAYFLGTDSITSSGVLLKIDIPLPPAVGVARASAVSELGFSASVDDKQITFSAPVAVEGRTIQVMDVVGRPCIAIILPPNSQTVWMPHSALRAGTYFARLGNACAKFTISN